MIDSGWLWYKYALDKTPEIAGSSGVNVVCLLQHLMNLRGPFAGLESQSCVHSKRVALSPELFASLSISPFSLRLPYCSSGGETARQQVLSQLKCFGSEAWWEMCIRACVFCVCGCCRASACCICVNVLDFCLKTSSFHWCSPSG